jgi:hypothetical protein
MPQQIAGQKTLAALLRLDEEENLSEPLGHTLESSMALSENIDDLSQEDSARGLGRDDDFSISFYRRKCSELHANQQQLQDAVRQRDMELVKLRQALHRVRGDVDTTGTSISETSAYSGSFRLKE